jgi:transforming growth factor-beta-induced protein
MLARLARLTAALLAVLALLAVATPAAAQNKQQPAILELAIAANSGGPYAGQFDTLIAAVLAADPAVATTLAGKGQFTVFAPTDAAFAKLGLDQNNVGGAFSQQYLTEVLLYHVARGNRNSASVIGSSQIRMLSGGFLSQSGGVLTDNLGRTASIVVADLGARNGVVHVIDSVVLPKAP